MYGYTVVAAKDILEENSIFDACVRKGERVKTHDLSFYLRGK